MKHKLAKENFIKKFNEKYPNYTIIEFESLSKPIVVIDELGVKYIKNNPFNALNHGFNIQSIVDKEQYIETKIKNYFPNLKLIKYDGIKKPVIVEDENGFLYRPQCYDLINGSVVTIETCDDKNKLFKFKANKKHNNFYDYDKINYINGKTKTTITCKIHGDFDQLPESHLSGHGCKKCATVGFSKESWLKRLKGMKAYFYVLRVFNDEEEFIKIGITSTTIEKRYKHLKKYEYDVLMKVEETPSKVYDIEKKQLKKYKNFKYLPKQVFEGWSECFLIETKNKITVI